MQRHLFKRDYQQQALNKIHEEEDGEDHLNVSPNRKLTVITKVKEKAKKWGQTITGKKSINNDNTTHMSSPRAFLEDYENGEDHNDCHEASSETDHHENRIGEKNIEASTSFHQKSLAEEVSEKLAPDYNGVKSELGTKSKSFSSLEELATSRPLTVTPSTGEDDSNMLGDDVAYGVYQESGLDKIIRDFMKTKLDQGEYEKALCQVISEAMSVRISPNDHTGVVEKVKEIVGSLLQAEEEEEEEQEREDEDEEVQNTPSAMWNRSSSSPSIPVSTNAYEDADEEESHERVLHAN